MRRSNEPQFELCFGGQKQFCKSNYTDLGKFCFVVARENPGATANTGGLSKGGMDGGGRERGKLGKKEAQVTPFKMKEHIFTLNPPPSFTIHLQGITVLCTSPGIELLFYRHPYRSISQGIERPSSIPLLTAYIFLLSQCTSNWKDER